MGQLEGTSEVVLAAHGRSPAKVAGEMYNEWLLAEIRRGADNKALVRQEFREIFVARRDQVVGRRMSGSPASDQQGISMQ